MSASTDPPARPAPAPPPRITSTPCSWCLGAGQYLERLDVEHVHAYLPLVCQGCMGTGQRKS